MPEPFSAEERERGWLNREPFESATIRRQCLFQSNELKISFRTEVLFLTKRVPNARHSTLQRDEMDLFMIYNKSK
jgi:hypothetical protein